MNKDFFAIFAFNEPVASHAEPARHCTLCHLFHLFCSFRLYFLLGLYITSICAHFLISDGVMDVAWCQYFSIFQYSHLKSDFLFLRSFPCRFSCPFIFTDSTFFQISSYLNLLTPTLRTSFFSTHLFLHLFSCCNCTSNGKTTFLLWRNSFSSVEIS